MIFLSQFTLSLDVYSKTTFCWRNARCRVAATVHRVCASAFIQLRPYRIRTIANETKKKMILKNRKVNNQRRRRQSKNCARKSRILCIHRIPFWHRRRAINLRHANQQKKKKIADVIQHTHFNFNFDFNFNFYHSRIAIFASCRRTVCNCQLTEIKSNEYIRNEPILSRVEKIRFFCLILFNFFFFRLNCENCGVAKRMWQKLREWAFALTVSLRQRSFIVQHLLKST